MPAPASPNAEARSKTRDSTPNLASEAASANPPIPPPTIPTRSWRAMVEGRLEEYPCRQLKLPRITAACAVVAAGGGDLADGRRSESSVGVVVVRRIGEVECIHTQLRLHPLGNLERPGQ